MLGQSGWQWVNNFPTHNNLWRINFPSEQTGYIISQDTSIIKTTNSGLTWRSSKLGSNFLSAIFFINEYTGYVSSYDNKLYKTSNGGESWEIIINGIFTATDIYFFNANTGVVATNNSIFRTTNAGYNWILIQSFTRTIRSLQFCGEPLTGYFLGWGDSGYPGYIPKNTIYSSLDLGITWYPISAKDSIYFSSMKFVNSSVGFLAGSGKVFKTTNSGVSWNINYYININSNILNYLPPNTIYLPGYKSTNNGMNWISQSLPINPYWITDILFINENTGFMVGSQSAILKTTDGGGMLSSVNYFSSIAPKNFSLSQNYPNPFNPNTVISYRLSVAGFTTLKVFDLLGKEVATLVNEKQSAGSYAVDFNSAEYNLPSGIYFYTLTAGEFKETRKMVLIK